VLPVVIDPSAVSIGLAGAADGLSRRLTLLRESGLSPLAVLPDASSEQLRSLTILFVAGLDQAASRRLAERARQNGVLVNVEDVPSLCDFHVPAVVRRGDLLISVSTSGKAPGLAKLIREWLERRLGLEWGANVETVSRARAGWRAKGHNPEEVSRRTRALVAERELLP
jgi:precorrin-2 dehydrogenase/sirohydrochlorin ferrochelatase